MSTFRVYTPFGGKIRANSTYCCCGTDHPQVQCCSPQWGGIPYKKGPRAYDIETSANSRVWFVGSGEIGSIKIERIANGICTGSQNQNTPQNDGVRVHIYNGLNAEGCYIGFVVYAHVTDLKVYNAQKINNPGFGGNCGRQGQWLVELGNIPPHNPAVSAGCYPVPHIHMNASAHGCADVFDRDWICNSSRPGWSKWIFKFVSCCEGDCS